MAANLLSAVAERLSKRPRDELHPFGYGREANVVLAIAFVLEGISFLRALRQTRWEAAERGLHPLRYIDQTSSPTLRGVFAEDAAALIGLLIALAGFWPTSSPAMRSETRSGRSWSASCSVSWHCSRSLATEPS